MSKIELTHIDKYYGKNHVLKDLNLTIEDGDFMTLLGPSGCGKTTTLRVVSGLEKPQNGIILMDGKEIVNAAEASFAPPSKRNLNLVFQSYALWPHMTVFDNVAFGLRIRKENSETIAKKVASALDRMQIGEFAKRYPTELSGGQQQRVAIARALIANTVNTTPTASNAQIINACHVCIFSPFSPTLPPTTPAKINNGNHDTTAIITRTTRLRL